MDEEDARLALLQTELNSIQNAIRSLDSINFQIKGWCVTTSLAAGGFAIAYHKPALVLVGMGAVAGFFLVNCQYKIIQTDFIRRNWQIDKELKVTGIMQVLKGAGKFDIVGTAVRGNSRRGSSVAHRVRRNLPALWSEARVVSTFSLYLFIFVCLIAEGAILL